MSKDFDPDDHEPARDMRVVNDVVRSVEKLKDLETEQSKRDTSPSPSAGGSSSGRAIITAEEEDRIRRAVIEHILKLRERKRREGGDR